MLSPAVRADLTWCFLSPKKDLIAAMMLSVVRVEEAKVWMALLGVRDGGCVCLFLLDLYCICFSLKNKVLVFDSRSPTNKNNKHNRQR